MDKIQISAEVLALRGAEVKVENYRSKFKTWELGIVSDVDIRVRADGKYRVVYGVRLYRKTASRGRTGGVICLTVGDDKIIRV